MTRAERRRRAGQARARKAAILSGPHKRRTRREPIAPARIVIAEQLAELS